MKNLILLITTLTSMPLVAQTYDLNKDIEQEYLERITVDNGDSLMMEFRNFAIDLFANGTTINDS